MKRFYSLLAALCMLMSLPVAVSAADNVKSEKIPVRLLSDVDAKESKTTKAEQEKETNYKVKALEDALKTEIYRYMKQDRMRRPLCRKE